MGKVALEGLEFFAYHGYYEEEQKLGNKYEVNIEVDTDLTKAAHDDILSGTVNYEILYKIVQEEMLISSKMLEHVAGRIISRALSAFPEITGVQVEISKYNPPVKGVCRKAKVTMSKNR
ncbi:MAG: dihydroneopterin aldolase [Cyclobacteriaceae bacterium]|nr:dihydroneopterin aldolase [Cyclobacteriaceae bacterium]